MANIQMKGIIIKQTDYGEANRMLTIFTDEYGIVKAASHGAKRIKSRQAAASQFLCYSDFSFYRGNSDVLTIHSADPIDSFFPVQEDIKKLSLGTYMADILYWSLDTGNPDRDVLRLFLNTLYALAYKDISVRKAKAVFELRCISGVGYLPMLQKCGICAAEDHLTHFRVSTGSMICNACKRKGDMPVTKEMYAAMVYILYAQDKKIFAFHIPDEILEKISDIMERYIMYQLDREFTSLAYYKKI